MRTAAVVALFIVLFAAVLLGVTAPAAGQTIPPIPTPLPTPDPLTPQPGCEEWCAPMPPTPVVPPPGIPPLVPTAEVESAFPGMPMSVNYLVFCPAVGRDER